MTDTTSNVPSYIADDEDLDNIPDPNLTGSLRGTPVDEHGHPIEEATDGDR
jgi:hypothetical protein